jgi:hypothetical protein
MRAIMRTMLLTVGLTFGVLIVEARAEVSSNTAINIECSKKADELKLHGPERFEFRRKCKVEARAKAPPKQIAPAPGPPVSGQFFPN